MSALEIVSRGATSDKGEFVRAFSELPSRARRDPYRVGIMPAVAAARFLGSDLPVVAEFWIARRGDDVLGRIGASLSSTDSGTGFIGFFELDVHDRDGEAAARELLAAASAWLAARSVRVTYAPVNFNTWFSYRFRLPSDDAFSYAWEPVQPPEYLAAFTTTGFTEVMRYRTDAFPCEAYAEAVKPSYDRAVAAKYGFRQFDFATKVESELALLHRISMVGFPGSFLFEPVPLDAFRELYVPALAYFDASPSHFLLDPSGKEVGFLFVFRDGESLVYKSVALLPEARGKGLSDSLFYAAWLKACEKSAPKWAVTALVRQGGQSESYSRKREPTWKHEYVLLKRG